MVVAGCGVVAVARKRCLLGNLQTYDAGRILRTKVRGTRSWHSENAWTNDRRNICTGVPPLRFAKQTGMLPNEVKDAKSLGHDMTWKFS
jgi:hypothetical protein